MNLGHGCAGHLPDYSFARYRYLPAWGDYDDIVKDNPHDYYCAFCQMVYALRYLRGETDTFELDRYDEETVGPWEEEIRRIIGKRQTIACADWKEFGERLSGKEIPDFSSEEYEKEYIEAGDEDKDGTFLGQFIVAALSQKSLITNKIFSSGIMLAGFSRDFRTRGFGGIKDFVRLVNREMGGGDK